jgi:hypothetical protein
MDPDTLVADAEHELRLLASALTDPRERECLLCYVHRMLEHGCDGTHRWATRFRDQRAPRVQGLVRRLSSMGACCCDCEIFMNAYEPVRQLWTVPPAGTSADAAEAEDEDEDEGGKDQLVPPGELPPCHGVRAGSTQGCAHWVRQRRRAW